MEQNGTCSGIKLNTKTLDHVGNQEPNIKKQKWKKLLPTATLVTVTFVVACSYSLLAPFFPREAEEKGATPTEYGLVFGVFQLVSFLLSPVYGKLSQRVSSLIILRFGLFLSGSCAIIFGSLCHAPAGKTFIALAFVFRIGEGVGFSAICFSSYAICSALYPDKIATVYSALETAFALGLTVGPSVGGALYQFGGYQAPFTVNGSLVLLFGILSFRLIPSRVGRASHNSGSYRKFLSSGGVISDLSIVLICFIAIGFNEATLEPHLRQFNLQPILLSLIFIIAGAVDAIFAPIIGIISDRSRDPQVYSLLGCLCCATSMIIVGPAPFIPMETTIWMICISQILLGLAMGSMVISGVANSLMDARARNFPDDFSTFALVSGVYLGVYSFGSFVGPSVGGFLLEHLKYKMACMAELGIIVTVSMSVVVFKCFKGWQKLRARGVTLDQQKTDMSGNIAQQAEPSIWLVNIDDDKENKFN